MANIRCLVLPNLHILMSSYTVPYILNLKEIAPAVPEVFAPNNKRMYKLCSCAPISMKFGAQVVLPKAYISTKFSTICSKIEENMSDTF